MPRIRRQNLPPRLLDHLLDRVDARNISAVHIGSLADWLRTDPEVPAGKWFKRFSGMTVCGEGELIKTFLQPGQLPVGEELLRERRRRNGRQVILRRELCPTPNIERPTSHSCLERRARLVLGLYEADDSG